MLINELSKKSGVSIHTIRFYEKSGLLKGKRDETIKSNNYFHYDEEALERLEMIQDVKSIGFTISEIAEFIDAWYSDTLEKNLKLKLLDEKMAIIKNKIKELNQMKKLIHQFKKDVENGEC